MGTSDTCCVYYLYNYYSTPTRLQINYIYFLHFFSLGKRFKWRLSIRW